MDRVELNGLFTVHSLSIWSVFSVYSLQCQQSCLKSTLSTVMAHGRKTHYLLVWPNLCFMFRLYLENCILSYLEMLMSMIN